MARQVKDVRLETRQSRLKLAIRKEPYWDSEYIKNGNNTLRINALDSYG